VVDSNTVIRFTGGRPVMTPLSLDELRQLFDGIDPDEPLADVPDTHGGMYVINVDEIVSLEGTSTPT
jgi:hypothetical protein